ncbi:hypothetical protein ACHAWF_006565 [Thalassiosira exigua]
MHTTWLKQALLDTRREHNPALFGTSVKSNLTSTEANSEVNRFLGWSTFSAMSTSFSKDTSDHRKSRKVVSCMILRERELTDEYVNEYYDPNMAMLNRGGLTLINSQFFKWGKKLMCAVRNAYSEDHITQDPQGSFGQAQDKVMSNDSLRSYFLALCRKQGYKDQEVCTKVYNVLVRKTTHARFAVVFRNWKEKHIKKNGKVDFRTKLKAGSTAKSNTKVKNKRSTNDNSPSPKRRQQSSAPRKGKRAKRYSDNPVENRKRRMTELREYRSKKRLRLQSEAISRREAIWELTFQAAVFVKPL